MRFILAFLILNCAFAAGARASNLRALSVVKVESFFDAVETVKLEGSGVLVSSSKGEFIVTSEHTVFDSRGRGKIRISNDRNCQADAEFVTSNWDSGLALLKIKDSACFKASPITFSRSDHESDISIEGFPIGSRDRLRYKHGKFMATVAKGSVLLSQEVAAIANLPAEYGMSGGVAIQGHDFFGLISHVSVDGSGRSYLIPSTAVESFIANPNAGRFFRTAEDFRYLFFSSGKSERLHERESGLLLIKRGPLLYVTLDVALANENGKQEVSSDCAFRSLKKAMLLNEVKLAIFLGFESWSLNTNSNFVQWLSDISRFSGHERVQYEDAEMENDYGRQGSISVPRGDLV